MKTTYRNVELESSYVGDKDWKFSGDSFHNYNNHKIVVKNLDTGRWTSFEYWESVRDREITTEKQLMLAFYCFLSDALSGELEYYDFCNKYGYDVYDGSSKKIWKACKVTTDKVNRVLPGWLDGKKYNDVMNEMQEKWGL